MNNDLAIVLSNDNKCNVKESLNGIINAGFKNVFIQWYDKDFEIDQLTQVELCKQNNLNIIFAHLGYQKINEIWTQSGDYFVDRYKQDILNVSKLGINMVIMHPCSKFEAPAPNEIGLNRFKEIIDYAEKLDVKVCIENTKIKDHLEYLLDNIHNLNFGLCFDVGHFHCNFKDNWNFEKYINRIFAVHLHDNHSESDEHLLPFDGNLDWNYIINKLNKLNYNGPITMEVCYSDYYLNMDIRNYYKEAYQRGLKLITYNEN